MTALGSLIFALSLGTASTAAAEPTAAEVASAPRPGDESGRLDGVEVIDSPLRKVARGVLLVPSFALQIAFAPLQAGVWTYERFQLGERAHRLFFNDAGTVSLIPTVGIESGFSGVNLGAKLTHRDVFGSHERLQLAASTGGRYRQEGKVAVRSGELLGKTFSIDLDGVYDLRPKDAFYGIGNADELGEARFRHRMMRAAGTLDARIIGDLHARFSGAVSDHEFDESHQGTPIGEVFMTDEIAGFAGTRNAYSEVELRYDSRRNSHAWDPGVVITAGTLAAAYAGRSTALDDTSDFWRVGGDVQQFFRIGEGPRVIMVRGHGEAVTGERGEVPFAELPRLGDKTLLRGYAQDRFRDRLALAASIEYRWDLARLVAANLFVDAGRVYRAADDLTLDAIRVGYGVGLELNTDKSFLARVSLASSIDGGVFFNFGLDPVFELDRRVDRR